MSSKFVEDLTSAAVTNALIDVTEAVDAERVRLLAKSNRAIRKLRETKAELAGARETLVAYDEKTDHLESERKRLIKKSNRAIRKLRIAKRAGFPTSEAQTPAA